MTQQSRVFILVLISTVSALTFSCKEPIDFDFGVPPTELVVDGFITDREKRHMIRLSYTSSLVDNVQEQRPVSQARVVLVDDLDHEIQLSGGSLGRFFTPLMAADPDRQYKLVVHHQEETYETTFEQLPTSDFESNIDIGLVESSRPLLTSNGNRLIDTQGIAVEAGITKTNENVHYQWLMSSCLAPVGFPFTTSRFCSVFNNLQKPRIKLLLDRENPGLNLIDYNHELIWLRARPRGPLSPGDVPRMWIIEIDQLLISEKAFNFWDEVRKSVENVGSIFDASPNRIVGNVTMKSTGKPALGFFGIYREARAFVRVELDGYDFVD